MGLIELPPELLVKISEYCEQADVVNLAIAIPSHAQVVTEVLYRCLVFDTCSRPMDLVRPFKVVRDGRHPLTAPISVVKTAAGIRQCLGVLKSRPDLGGLVWSIEGRSNIELSDAQLLVDLKAAFTNLTSLLSLEWTACPELPLEVLSLLPRPDILETLRADLALRPWQQKMLPSLNLRALRRLEIRPYLNAGFLQWLRATVENCDCLEDVWLSRSLSTKSEVGSGYAFAAVGDGFGPNNLSAVAHFFPVDPVRKWPLKRLGLIETTANEGDGSQLLACADLSQLRDLALCGTDFDGPLLAAIASERPPVRRLQLDWDAPNCVVMNFLRILGPYLESLELHVKRRPREMAKAVACSVSPLLRELTLVMDCAFQVEDLADLSEFHNLRRLSLPFNSQIRSWEVAHGLPELRTLSLWNQGSSTGRVGLLTGGLFNEWDVSGCSYFQYAPILASLRVHNSLEHLEIDGNPVHFTT